MNIKQLKKTIILIVLLSTIGISTSFAAASEKGYFFIDGRWIYGTVFANTITITGQGYIEVTPPWTFIGHLNDGTTVMTGSETEGARIPGPLGNPLDNVPRYNEEKYFNSMLQSCSGKYWEILFNLNNIPYAEFMSNIAMSYTNDSNYEFLLVASISNPIDIAIFDLSGKILYSITDTNAIIVDKDNLPQQEGTYIIKMVSEDQVATIQFVVSNGKGFFKPVNTVILDEVNTDSELNSSVEYGLDINYYFTSEEIQISSVSNPMDVELFDLSGKKVYSITNSNVALLNTKNLPQTEGTYILRITSGSQYETKKIVISNGSYYISSEK